jgi:hypothetical protein
MTELSNLIVQLQQLSAESQARVAEYMAFLRWREAQQQAAQRPGWSFSFIEAFKEAAILATDNPAGMDVTMGPAVVGGERRPALWAHPPVVGQAVIEYHVPVPQQVQEVQLHLAIGIRDGAKIAPDNLVAFGVRVNGVRVWGQQTNELAWQETSLSLDLASGDMVRFEFTTEALASHEWTWAVWGGPELVGKLREG